MGGTTATWQPLCSYRSPNLPSNLLPPIGHHARHRWMCWFFLDSWPLTQTDSSPTISTKGYYMGLELMPSSSLCSSSRNHPSSLANKQVVSSYIAEEVTLGRMVGPVTPRLHQHLHVSPIGLVPKGRGSGRWQMIVDLSSSVGHSTNDRISSDLCSLRYSSVDDALEYIGVFGRYTQLSKIDLNNAYRILPGRQISPCCPLAWGCVCWPSPPLWVTINPQIVYGVRRCIRVGVVRSRFASPYPLPGRLSVVHQTGWMSWFL